MRPAVVVFVALWLVLSAAGARAQQGFVVEAHKATPELGAPLGDATTISIEPGGHIIVMTGAARMIRRDGPYRGHARDLLEAPAPAPESGEPLARNLLLGLLELAKASGRSEEVPGGVRGAGLGSAAAEAGPYAIGPGAGLFCIHDDMPPAFFTPDPPQADATLVIRRITRPKALLRAGWPAGVRRMGWPEGWPPPAKGRYLVAIGQGGGWAVRLIPVGPRPASAVRQAALYYEAGCRRQAAAALRLAVNKAERR